MKTNLFKIAIAIVSLCLGIVSCSKDDDSESGSSKTVTANITFDPATNDVFTSVGVMKVAYTVKDSGHKSGSEEGFCASPIELTNLDCPCTVTFTYSFQKLNVEIDSEKVYSMQYGPVITVETSSGTLLLDGSATKMPTKGSTLDKFFDNHSKTITKTITLDKNGSVVK